MPNIRHSISIEAPRERIFPLIASGRGFSQWWAADVAEVGSDGTVDLGFFNRATVYRLKPVRIASLAEAEWICQSGKEWEGTRLLFQISKANNASLLRFTHADWQADTDYFVSCTTTWGELMFRLKAVAEGKTPGPLFSAAGMAY
jgi:uncharacterized protein YndB with AHSA1/START domain